MPAVRVVPLVTSVPPLIVPLSVICPVPLPKSSVCPVLSTMLSRLRLPAEDSKLPLLTRVLGLMVKVFPAVLEMMVPALLMVAAVL